MAATGKNNQGKNDSKRNNLKKNATDFKEKISNGEPMRLNKFLSDAGVCSRRQADRYVEQGRILVDGEPAQMGQKVHAGQDIRVDGKRVSVSRKQIVLAVNKPKGIVCTTEKREKDNIVDFIGYPERIYPVGRLDKDTEGLLLITDDGALAHELLSPKKHVDKTYYAVTDGCVTKEDVQRFAEGLEIGEKNPTMPAKLEILRTRKVEETELEQYPSGWSSEIQLTIKEGKFHQVKRMTEAVGKKVVYLKRISMGVLTLPDDLKKGECRQLTAEEEKKLKDSIGRS